MATPAPEITAGCAIFTLMLIAAILIPIIGIIIFWLCMIIYCIKYQKNDRTAWIIVNFLCGPFGNLIYIFFKDKKPNKLP